jgi:hypothetical protein
VPYDSDTVWVEYRIPLDGEVPGEKKNDDPVPYLWEEGDVVNIAAHGVAGLCDCEDLLAVLPDTVLATVEYPGYPDVMSYFKVTIPADGIMGGVHRGWCGDADTLVAGDDIPLEGAIYSTICDDVLEIPEGAITYDANIPAVNWLLNNWESLGGYTVGDVQAAIWLLLSDKYPDPPLGTLSIEYYDTPGWPWPEAWAFDNDRALELEDAANDNLDFEPVCGEVMVVVFIPPVWDTLPPVGAIGDPRQAVLIEIPAPCCETVWGGLPVTLGGPDDSDENGYGIDFDGSNWAMYFPYVIQ